MSLGASAQGRQLGKHSSNSDDHESQHFFNAYVDQTHVKRSAQSARLSPPQYLSS